LIQNSEKYNNLERFKNVISQKWKGIEKNMKRKNLLVLITLVTLMGSFWVSNSPNIVKETLPLSPIAASLQAGTDVEYLIITINDFKNELEPLALWKTQKGVNAEIVTTNEINLFYSSGYDLAERIKMCIADYALLLNTKFVLLAGDHQDIPTREVYIQENYFGDGNYVGCDSYYTNFNNWDSDGDHIYAEDTDDWNLTPDVYVGRLSVNTEQEMKMLADRIILYESNPPVGEWMNTALFAGAMTYFNADEYGGPGGDNNLDYPEADGNRFFNYVYDQFFTDMQVTLLAEDQSGTSVGSNGTSQYFHNGSLTAESLEEGIWNGTSILGVLGHGNAVGVYRTIWDVDRDDDGLFDWNDGVASSAYDYYHSEFMIHTDYSYYSAHNNMYPLTYLMGCSNGNFTTLGTDSLAEYMLKTVSIGSIGADRIVWGEDNWTERAYGGWYSEGLAYRFFEQLNTNDQPGKAMALAKQDYSEDLLIYNTSSNWAWEPKWSEKTLKHFNYFGDPELHIWMKIPEVINATWTENGTETLVDVFTGLSTPLDSVSVTLTDETGSVFWAGATNSSGQVTIPFSYSIVNESMLVAYKPRYIPLMYQPFEIISPDSPVLAEISPSIDRDGNINLEWNDVVNATSYNLYRDTSLISDIYGLTPIYTGTATQYTDKGLSDGFYFYVVTAVANTESDPSNCVYVAVEHRNIPGFSITILVIVGFVGLIMIAGAVVTKVRIRR
jgi:hypothetical protein